MIISEPILTDRLLLRNLKVSDISMSYLDWFGVDEIVEYLEVRFSPPKTIGELKKFVELINRSEQELLLGIFLKDTRQHIGNIKLGPINPAHQRGDIGFIIGDCNQWGRGYATEAIKAATYYAFNTLCLSKVSAGCYSGNVGSARALLKAGFTQEACLESHWNNGDCRENGLLFGLLNPKIAACETRSE